MESSSPGRRSDPPGADYKEKQELKFPSQTKLHVCNIYVCKKIGRSCVVYMQSVLVAFVNNFSLRCECYVLENQIMLVRQISFTQLCVAVLLYFSVLCFVKVDPFIITTCTYHFVLWFEVYHVPFCNACKQDEFPYMEN